MFATPCPIIDEPEAIQMLLDRLFNPSPNTVPVIHPSFKALGRIWVPWPVLAPTGGLDRALQNHPHAPSLCVLYQTGKCYSREKCNQIHVDRHWAATVWHALELASANSCCRSCGDLPSLNHEMFVALQGQQINLRIPGAPPFAVPVEQIAATRFWQRFIHEERTNLYFTPDRVCVLHQQNTCKYGVECKNVHMCRIVWQEVVKTVKDLPGVSLGEQWTADTERGSDAERPTAHAAHPPTPHRDILLAEVAVEAPTPSAPAKRKPGRQPLAIVHPSSGEQVAMEKKSRGLPIVDPKSGEAIAIPSITAVPLPVTEAQAASAARRSPHALAIVHPVSGAEVTVAAAPAAHAHTEGDDLERDHASIRCASAVLADDEGEVRPVADHRRVPTLEKMSAYNAADAVTPATRWQGQGFEGEPGDSEVSRDGSSGGTPVSPSSSLGSSCDGASTASHRSFPKPAAKSKAKGAKDAASSTAPRGVDPRDAKAWAVKMEASRGLFKKAATGLLGVVLTAGPNPHGFGMGRGCPV